MSERQTKRLTTKRIESLERKPPAKTTEHPDGGGLYLTVRPSGSASFNLRYRYNGKPCNLTLGPVALGLTAARELAREALVKVAKGEDPAAQKQEKRAAEKAKKAREDDRIESVIDSFIAREAKRKFKPAMALKCEQELRREVLPRWKGKRIGDVKPTDIHKILDAMIDRGAPVGANRTLTIIKLLFKFAAARHLIASDANPCAHIRPPTKEKGRARKRILFKRVGSGEESRLDWSDLRLVWQASERLGYPYGEVVRFLILTGQRRTEVTELTWSEIDLDNKVWTISKERAKNKEEHEVPLSDAAIKLLRGLPRFAGSDFVFGAKPPTGFPKAKQKLDRIIAELNGGKAIDPYVLHDLRRTVASGMQSLKIDLPIIEKVLNHKSGSFGGIVSSYQLYQFADEKREALNKWAAHVARIIEGGEGNVVPFVEGKRRGRTPSR